MSNEDFSDATLVILGHGSTKNEESSSVVYQHAAELRRRQLFADVREALWKEEPQIKSVLAELTAPRIFIAPLFMSEGYFSEDVIPRALDFHLTDDPVSRIKQTSKGIILYCRPIGTHEGMTGVLLSRAREVASKFPFPRWPRPQDITLFIAGHGTEQNENSRKSIEQQAARIRNLKQYADVHAVFLEEAPQITKCYELARTRNIIVVPYFISEGMHTQEDIPILLGEPRRAVEERLAKSQPTWRNPTERHEKLVWYAAPAGTEPHVADVILERVHECCAVCGDRRPSPSKTNL